MKLSDRVFFLRLLLLLALLAVPLWLLPGMSTAASH